MGRDFADDMFAAMYRMLKPGGTLGVVEHRGNPDVPQDPQAASGYVNEDYAIALAEKAGFKLVDKSEINANPKDTKDYETGVWTLPPTMRAGDKPEYRAIGESDRFTLKFTK
jgi:predicted methyltransferase